MKAIRHGDVILRPIERLSNPGKPLSEYTLAHGEVTGHHHTLYPILGAEVLLLAESNGTREIELKEPWALRHQEHFEIIVPPGCYEIGIEREYDPFANAIKKVID